MKKVGVKDLDREVKRLIKEVSINPYLRFTFDSYPTLKAQVSVAGAGSLGVDEARKFAADLDKAIKIADTFKYQGYELDYSL